MKVTLDTNFLISATLWDKSVANKILIKLVQEDAQLFTTKDILTEYAEVLARDFNYSESEIEERIQKIIGRLKVIEPTIKLKVVKDADDDKILECAVSSMSDYIITYDKVLGK